MDDKSSLKGAYLDHINRLNFGVHKLYHFTFWGPQWYLWNGLS